MPKLDPERFLDLIEQVEVQGGHHLPGVCEPKPYDLDMPRPDGVPAKKRVLTSGCGLETRFMVEYRTEKGESGMLTACANDDLMDRWPRFEL